MDDGKNQIAHIFRRGRNIDSMNEQLAHDMMWALFTELLPIAILVWWIGEVISVTIKQWGNYYPILLKLFPVQLFIYVIGIVLCYAAWKSQYLVGSKFEVVFFKGGLSSLFAQVWHHWKGKMFYDWILKRNGSSSNNNDNNSTKKGNEVSHES